MVTVLLLFLFAFALAGGGLGYRHYGLAGGMGPVGLVITILLVLYLTGNLHGVQL